MDLFGSEDRLIIIEPQQDDSSAYSVTFRNHVEIQLTALPVFDNECVILYISVVQIGSSEVLASYEFMDCLTEKHISASAALLLRRVISSPEEATKRACEDYLVEHGRFFYEFNPLSGTISFYLEVNFCTLATRPIPVSDFADVINIVRD